MAGSPAAVAAIMRCNVGRNGGNTRAISGSRAYSSRSAGGGRVSGNSLATNALAAMTRDAPSVSVSSGQATVICRPTVK